MFRASYDHLLLIGGMRALQHRRSDSHAEQQSSFFLQTAFDHADHSVHCNPFQPMARIIFPAHLP